MTRELESLREQLERATSRSPANECELDHETASLRDGWVSWCESLAASDTAWDDRALVTAMAREERAARRAVWWSLAVALSMIGIVVGAFTWLDRRAQGTARHMAQVARARALVAEAPGVSADGAKSTDNAETWAWNDELDEQLVAAQETLVLIRTTWVGPTDQVGLLSQRLEELRSEFADEAL